ncbi:MAG: hypothetical protein ACFCUG_08185 [Thiotrichales bacterium]
MNQRLLALYGLKWNPFTPDAPTEALYVPPQVENFCWRIEQTHLREGGFALVHGDPGSGKSVVMRLLAERLARLTDLDAGNYRICIAAEFLIAAAQRDLTVLDEKLYLQVFAQPPLKSARTVKPEMEGNRGWVGRESHIGDPV